MILTVGTSLRGWLSGPLRSLASRLILSVFSAALISSLVVTWTSTRSTESFLRSKIEEHYPELLRTSRQRLALWFAQRELDITTFAASETVEALVEASRTIAPGPPRTDISATCSRPFPSTRPSSCAGSDGEISLWSGEQVPLTAPVLERLARRTGTHTLALRAEGEALHQIVSAPIEPGGDSRGALHGVVSPDALGSVGAELELGGTRRLFILDGSGKPRVPGR